MLDLGISGTVTGTVGRQGSSKKQVARLPAIKGKNGGAPPRGMSQSAVGMCTNGSGVGVANEIDAKMNKARGGMQRGALGQAASAARDRARMAASGDSGIMMQGQVLGNIDMSATDQAPLPMRMPEQLSAESAGIAFQQRQVQNKHQENVQNKGGIVFDVEAMQSDAHKSPKQRAPERKPRGMQRAKEWTVQVENMFRFQLAGWRDVFEYLTTHEQPTMWEEEGFVRCLQNRNGNFMYFRKTRECESKHLPKVKIYTY
jgi:hypothetical protein